MFLEHSLRTRYVIALGSLYSVLTSGLCLQLFDSRPWRICKKQIASVHVEDRLYYFKIIYPPMGIETSTVMAFGRQCKHF